MNIYVMWNIHEHCIPRKTNMTNGNKKHGLIGDIHTSSKRFGFPLLVLVQECVIHISSVSSSLHPSSQDVASLGYPTTSSFETSGTHRFPLAKRNHQPSTPRNNVGGDIYRDPLRSSENTLRVDWFNHETPCECIIPTKNCRKLKSVFL